MKNRNFVLATLSAQEPKIFIIGELSDNTFPKDSDKLPWEEIKDFGRQMGHGTSSLRNPIIIINFEENHLHLL